MFLLHPSSELPGYYRLTLRDMDARDDEVLQSPSPA